MSKELPFFKFYPSEWMMGRINQESTIDQIAFLRACCMYWHRDCQLKKSEILLYITEERVKSLCDKGYMEILNNDSSDYKISIKFLDEQHDELGGARQRRVESGRIGGLKTQAKIKQRLSTDEAEVKDLDKNKNKKKKRSDYINEAIYNNDPNLRVSKEIAEKLIDAKIKNGEIVV